MVTYNKTLTPPEGVEVQETHDGLKFWKVPKVEGSLLPTSVQTEDPEISMYWYGGGRDEGHTYLFRFQGAKIGFVRHVHTRTDLADSDLLPGLDPAPSLGRDPETGVITDTVTAVGTPVYSYQARLKLNEDGTPVKDDQGRSIRKKPHELGKTEFVTGLTWRDWNDGKRDKFDSFERQEAMRAIWAELYPYLSLSPLNKRLVFSDKVLKQFESGELIK